jgi:ribosomal protein S27AE
MVGMGYVVIAIAFGLAGGVVGRMKGSSFWIWFLISGLVPVFGLLAAVFYRWEDRELRRQCPRCGRVVMLYDAICTRCGEELDFPDTAIESEAAMRERAA